MSRIVTPRQTGQMADSWGERPTPILSIVEESMHDAGLLSRGYVGIIVGLFILRTESERNRRMDVRPLREWSLKRGYGVLEFARLTGLSTTTMIALETGRSRGYGRTWRKAAHALGVEPEQLLEYWRAVRLDDLEADRCLTASFARRATRGGLDYSKGAIPRVGGRFCGCR